LQKAADERDALGGGFAVGAVLKDSMQVADLVAQAC